MSEKGGSGPENGRPKFEGGNVIDAREVFERVRRERERQGDEFPNHARKFLEAGEIRVNQMDEEPDPRRVREMIERLELDVAQYATGLDSAAGGKDHADLSREYHDQFLKMDKSVPPGDPGTIPPSVLRHVSGKMWTAKEFAEVAVTQWEKSGAYEGTLDAACDAAWGAIAALYKGMIALPRPH